MLNFVTKKSARAGTLTQLQAQNLLLSSCWDVRTKNIFQHAEVLPDTKKSRSSSMLEQIKTYHRGLCGRSHRRCHFNYPSKKDWNDQEEKIWWLGNGKLSQCASGCSHDQVAQRCCSPFFVTNCCCGFALSWSSLRRPLLLQLPRHLMHLRQSLRCINCIPFNLLMIRDCMIFFTFLPMRPWFKLLNHIAN